MVNDYDFFMSEPIAFSEKASVNRAHAGMHFDLSDSISFDASLYWNNSYTVLSTKIPEHVRLDLGATFNITDDMEISLIGQNLVSPEHREYINRFSGSSGAEIPRRALVNMRLVF